MAVTPRDTPAQSAPPAASSSDLKVSTLVITALASAGAAIISAEVFGAGTLISAALTPVVIALLKEALDRPRRVVSTVVPAAVPLKRRRPGRRRPPSETSAGAGEHRPGDSLRDPAAQAAQAAPGSPSASRGRARPREDAPPPVLPLPAEHGEVRVYRSTRRRWRLAIITGLLGFTLAAAVLTVTELAAGGALAGDARSTTYFGGGSSERSSRDDEQPPATTQEGEDAAPSTTTPDGSGTRTQTTPQPPEEDATTTPQAPAAPDGGTTPPAGAPPEGAPAQPQTPAPSTPAPAPAPGGAPAAPATP